MSVAPFSGIDTALLLQKAMKVAEMNHRIIANNIANADTPNYNAARLDFQATLRNAVEGRGRVSLRRTQARHFDVRRNRTKFEPLVNLSKNDYNKVDLDQEIAALAENSGKFTVFSALLAKRFEQIKGMLNSLR